MDSKDNGVIIIRHLRPERWEFPVLLPVTLGLLKQGGLVAAKNLEIFPDLFFALTFFLNLSILKT
jgi:hypothetical protein